MVEGKRVWHYSNLQTHADCCFTHQDFEQDCMYAIHSNAYSHVDHNRSYLQAVHSALCSVSSGSLCFSSCVCVLTILSVKQVHRSLQKPHLRSAHVVQDLHGILPVAQLCIGAQQSHICHDVWLQPGCVHVIKHLLHLHDYSCTAEAHTSYLVPDTMLTRCCPFLIDVHRRMSTNMTRDVCAHNLQDAEVFVKAQAETAKEHCTNLCHA